MVAFKIEQGESICPWFSIEEVEHSRGGGTLLLSLLIHVLCGYNRCVMYASHYKGEMCKGVEFFLYTLSCIWCAREVKFVLIFSSMALNLRLHYVSRHHDNR